MADPQIPASFPNCARTNLTFLSAKNAVLIFLSSSCAGTELGLLKYVKDRSIVDAAKLPSAELLWQLYQKDSRMDEARAKLVCDRYEKKIELFQRWQQGQDLNPRRFYKNCRTVQIQKQKEKGFE